MGLTVTHGNATERVLFDADVALENWPRVGTALSRLHA